MQLLVVGGKRPAPWRRLAARLGVAAAVRFTEPVEDLVPYYAAADVYAHPTIYDTCSLVVLEAAACGLPVVTTRCNGAAELFHDGRDIVLAADPADDEHFAAGAQGLLVSPAARRALGEAARRTALRKPSTATWTTSRRCTRKWSSVAPGLPAIPWYGRHASACRGLSPRPSGGRRTRPGAGVADRPPTPI